MAYCTIGLVICLFLRIRHHYGIQLLKARVKECCCLNAVGINVAYKAPQLAFRTLGEFQTDQLRSAGNVVLAVCLKCLKFPDARGLASGVSDCA